MKITETKIKVSDLVENYKDNGDGGVFGYNDRLTIRPSFQREFIYGEKQRAAVIDSVMNGFPLNVMYWSKTGADTYEVLDGQQRTVSIAQYINKDFPVTVNGNDKFFQNLTNEEKQAILDYELTVYVCEGTEAEKLEWFKRINIAGEVLTPQELLNATYTGPWLADAKNYFSKRNCVAAKMADGYLKGNPIRQELLEKALTWIADRDGLESGQMYMAIHQHDELLGNFAKHYTDMEIDRSQTCRDADGTSRDFARAINIYNSLFAKNSDGSTSSFNNALWKQLSISIYSGTKYPEQVLSLALLRSCRLLQQNKKGKENRITASLAGITKAFLIRNYGENMTMGLNSNNTSPAYITGRIFAHMESAQRKIDPNNQTTYAKRFFERVMMNPAKTMPELHKSFLLLKNKAKANGMRGLYNSSDKKIMALIDMLDGNYPDHLSEKQKGEYLVGYYQQRSANIKDAEEKKNRKAAKIETNNTDTATTVSTQKEK